MAKRRATPVKSKRRQRVSRGLESDIPARPNVRWTVYVAVLVVVVAVLWQFHVRFAGSVSETSHFKRIQKTFVEDVVRLIQPEDPSSTVQCYYGPRKLIKPWFLVPCDLRAPWPFCSPTGWFNMTYIYSVEKWRDERRWIREHTRREFFHRIPAPVKASMRTLRARVKDRECWKAKWLVALSTIELHLHEKADACTSTSCVELAEAIATLRRMVLTSSEGRSAVQLPVVHPQRLMLPEDFV